MIDWLVVWGVTQAAGFAFGSIMQELAKEGAKEYGKEFFKNSLGKVLHLPEKDEQKEAYGKALKAFLEIFQQQLEMANLTDDEVKAYVKPLKIFIQDEAVKPILGDAFAVDCTILDTFALAQSWQSLSLSKLPNQFNWENVGKFYLRKVKEIIEASDKLKTTFSTQQQHESNTNIREIAGVSTDFDLERYAKALKQEYGNLKLESLDTTAYEQIKLWSMFVPQNVKRCKQFVHQLYEIPKEILQKLLEKGEIDQLELVEAELERKRKEYFNEQLHQVLNIVNSHYKKIVFLGDPGAGKSSLLQYLGLTWAKKDIGERTFDCLPLLVELRIYARDKEGRKCQNFLEFFHKGNFFCHLNQHSLDYKLKKGQAIALFDGLDEVFDPTLRDEIVTDIKNFSIKYPQIQIIVTSRWLGYKAEELRNIGFEHFMLQDLDEIQIPYFIQRWHNLAFQDREDKKRKQVRLEKAITESKAIRELAGNPLLLTMMAILNRTQELPRDRPKLYERASEILLHQWDFETKEGLKDPELEKYLYNIDLRDKKEILRSVANAMQAGEKGLAANLIYRQDLETIIARYLASTGIAKREANDLTDLIIKQLRYRNFILCSLGGNSFAFVHRTFLEYFCACEFYERYKKRGLQGGITLEELKIEVFGQHWQDSSWREVLRLLIGMLSAEFPREIAEELINYLIEQNGTEKEFSNIFLATDCFSELRNRSIFAELSNLILENLESLSKLDNDKDLSEKAVFTIANIWQDDLGGWRKLQSIAQSDVAIYVEKEAIKSLSTIARSHAEALPLLQKLAIQGKSEAIAILAEHWRNDSQTLPIIQQQARQGNNQAIAILAEHWRNDSQALPIIQQQAQVGNTNAITALVQHWQTYSEALPIIQQEAKNGNNEAIVGLAEHWHNDPQTLLIIRQLAQEGKSVAINALVQHWRNDSQTLPIIQKQAQIGNIEAITFLAQHEQYHQEILLIIHEQFSRKAIKAEELFEAFEKGTIEEKSRAMLEQVLEDSDFPLYLKQMYQKMIRKKMIRKKATGSHFSTIRSKITDAEILVNSLRDLNISVQTNTYIRGYNGQRILVDVAAFLEGEYDLGWSEYSNGTFDLIADLHGVAIKHNLTELINSIYQKYNINKTLKEVKRRKLNKDY